MRRQKRPLGQLLEGQGQVTRHSPLWKSLLSPGEQLAAQGEYHAAKKALTQSIEAVVIITSDDEGTDGGDDLSEDGAPVLASNFEVPSGQKVLASLNEHYGEHYLAMLRANSVQNRLIEVHNKSHPFSLSTNLMNEAACLPCYHGRCNLRVWPPFTSRASSLTARTRALASKSISKEFEVRIAIAKDRPK